MYILTACMYMHVHAGKDSNMEFMLTGMPNSGALFVPSEIVKLKCSI